MIYNEANHYTHLLIKDLNWLVRTKANKTILHSEAHYS